MAARVEQLYDRAQALVHADRRRDAERVLLRALAAMADRPAAGGVSRARLLTSLAAIRAELGHSDEGLALLAEVERSLPADDPLLGVVLAQRGIVLLRAGRLAEAGRAYAVAAPHVRDDPAQWPLLLLNRGAVHLLTGRLGEARRDYRECCAVALAPQVGPDVWLRAVFNLAYVDYLGGDLVGALAGLDEVLAHPGLAETGLGAEISQTRALILAAAGLLGEADAEFARAAAEYAALPSPRDVAESELGRAVAALADDRPRDAELLARRARSAFARRGVTGWALVAELTEVQARLARVHGRAACDRLAARAVVVAAALDTAGLAEDARIAALAAAQAYLLAGRPELALQAAGSGLELRANGGSTTRLTTRLQARQVRADLAAGQGRPAAARRELAAGMAELHGFQASLGSFELQTAVARHGRELARRGLAGALAGGSAGSVFAWAERTRGLASRLPPVRPPDDEQTAALLEQLRFVRTGLRESQLAGSPDLAAQARAAALERRVRERSWAVQGSGRAGRPVQLAEVRALLSARGQAGLVAHVLHEGGLFAVVVTPRGARLTRLGPAAEVVERARRVRADLDVLAGRGFPERMRAVVAGGLAHTVAALDAALWAPVASQLPDGPVVLVPAGVLTALPWGALPGLIGRPVTVARSATAWASAAAPSLQRSGSLGRSGPASGLTAVVTGGPDLDRVGEEVDAVAACWGSGARVLTGAAATGAAVLAAADGAALLHVAAHGVHEPGSPLFSALRLADGPLFGYDVGRVPTMPAVVVLSACELGVASTRPGEEVLGMTAAFLHAGAVSVVSGVARIADDVACEVMPAFHTGLARGLGPAAALAAATRDRSDAPFVCFGAG